MEINPEEWKSLHRNGDQSRGMEIRKAIQRNGSQFRNTRSIQRNARSIHRNARSIHRNGSQLNTKPSTGIQGQSTGMEKKHIIFYIFAMHLHKHIVLFLCPLFSYLYYCLQFLHPILNSPLHHHPLSVVSSSAVFEAHTLYGNTTWHVKTS